MKAVAVHPSQRAVRLIDHPAPAIQTPTQVRLRVLEVGVCGTDKEICAMEYGTPPASDGHLVIGHEALARVEEVGPGVTKVRVGDLVVPMVRRPCAHDHCASCRVDRQDFCFTGDFHERGIRGLHGFMTEQIVEDERWLHRLPQNLRDVGVLVEPLTIAEKAMIQVRALQQRLPWQCATGGGHCHRAVVLGAGPVGLLGAMALVAEGFSTWVYSRRNDRRTAVVEAIGARFVPAEEVPPEELASVVGNIDLVYEAMGASALSFEVMKQLGANGVFVFTGVPGRKGPVPLDTDQIMRNLVLRNQIVLGTVNAGRDAFASAVSSLEGFVARWPQATRELITGHYPVEHFADLLLGRADGIKNVIRFAA